MCFRVYFSLNFCVLCFAFFCLHTLLSLCFSAISLSVAGLVVSVVFAFSICRAVGFFLLLRYFAYFLGFFFFLVVNLLVAPSFV